MSQPTAQLSSSVETPHSLFEASVLVVDDSSTMRMAMMKALNEIGFRNISRANDGRQAIALAKEKPFDLMLLDLEMPEMNGLEVLKAINADPELQGLPVIVISGNEEIENAVQCIELGAEDYLTKPFNATLLRARVNTSLEKKRLRDLDKIRVVQLQEEKTLLEATQKRLEKELQEAAHYVASILPPPETDPLPISWTYLPSTELGGDSFGYHWIDDDHFAIYLLDVCGHGVGAALLSVAAINVLRSGALQGRDFRKPGEVLEGLNESFQMDRHNFMYFTIWYGVYQKSTRTLIYASGGHPPSVLFTPKADGRDEQSLLGTRGMLIGAMEGTTYEAMEVQVPPGSRLYVYCDGAYEIRLADRTMLDFDEVFLPKLKELGRSPTASEEMLEWARSLNTGPVLADDFSVVSIDFP